MSTGKKLAIFTLKRMLSATDLDSRFFGYLRDLVREHFSVSYDVPCTFSSDTEKWTLTSSSDDHLTIVAAQMNPLVDKATASDGLGNIIHFPLPSEDEDLDIGKQKTFKFPNNTGTTYYLALKSVLIPSGIRINPRSGAPEYDCYTEAIGEEVQPANIVDNFNGTMTMEVPTIGGHGVSLATRLAMVYRVTPASGATSEEVAIARIEVSYSGGLNKVTTSYLGQTSPSTTTSQYRVVVLGPTITDAAFPSGDGWVELATIDGNGPAESPTSFDYAYQVVVDASLVRAADFDGGINWYDGTTNPATTVDAQLDKILTDLAGPLGGGAGQSGLGGGHKIRGPSFASVPWVDSSQVASQSIGQQLLEIVQTLASTSNGSSGARRTGVEALSVANTPFGTKIAGIVAGQLRVALQQLLDNGTNAARLSLEHSMSQWKKVNVYAGTDAGAPVVNLTSAFAQADAILLTVRSYVCCVTGDFDGRGILMVSTHWGNFKPFDVGPGTVTKAYNGRFINFTIHVAVTDGGVGAIYTHPQLQIAAGAVTMASWTLDYTLTGSTMAKIYEPGGLSAHATTRLIVMGDNGKWATKDATTWTARPAINSGDFTGMEAIYLVAQDKVILLGIDGSGFPVLVSFDPDDPDTLTTLTLPGASGAETPIGLTMNASGFCFVTVDSFNFTWIYFSSNGGTTFTNLNFAGSYKAVGCASLPAPYDQTTNGPAIIVSTAVDKGIYAVNGANGFVSTGQQWIATAVVPNDNDEELSSVAFDSGDASLPTPKSVHFIGQGPGTMRAVIIDNSVKENGSDEFFGRIWVTGVLV